MSTRDQSMFARAFAGTLPTKVDKAAARKAAAAKQAAKKKATKAPKKKAPKAKKGGTK